MEKGVVVSAVRAPDLDLMLTETIERTERVFLGKRPAETLLTRQEEHKKRNKKNE